MISNIRLYARINKDLAMFVLGEAETYDAAIETVRAETKLVRVLAVVDNASKA